MALTIEARTSDLSYALCGRTARSQSFEGRVEGQFGRWGRPRVPLNVIEDYFIPDGEAIALAHLSDEVRALYSDKERAFEAFLRTFIA